MKKVIVLIGLITSLIITGCTKNEESEKEAVTTIVYCSSCGEESKEVTQFCSSCGEEAKWLAEKPDIVKDKEAKESVKEVNTTEKEITLNSNNKKYSTCDICGEKYDNDINGYCSEDCYNIAANTKADGYYDNRCKGEGCFYQMSEDEMNERDGYCEECWIESCSTCGGSFPRSVLNFYNQYDVVYCDECDRIHRECKNGFPICDGCFECI